MYNRSSKIGTAGLTGGSTQPLNAVATLICQSLHRSHPGEGVLSYASSKIIGTGWVRQGQNLADRKEVAHLADNKEKDVIFVRYFRHYRTGKIVYPKKGEFIKIVIKK